MDLPQALQPHQAPPAPKIFVLHENDVWTAPLERELTRLGLPYELWFLDEGTLDLSEAPPPGIYYSRMSASSHTRDHRFAAEYTGCVLSWLESHQRTVLNGSRALSLEVSKVAQYAALEARGIRTPYTVAAIGRNRILEAARRMSGPFVTKHNRGGKGLGVRRFNDLDSLATYLESPDHEAPVDGVTLVQSYIEAPDSLITRCEFVGQRFLYALQVDTSNGFELCPAQECAPDGALCPASDASRPRFRVLEDFDDSIIRRYERFIRANDIHVAGIEFVTDREGVAFTYDINTNTNYNAEAEAGARAGHSGMAAIAAYLGQSLEDLPSSYPRARLKVAS